MSQVDVQLVDDRETNRLFCDLPYELYRDDTNWVAPLRSAERARWRSRNNAALRARWCRRLIAIQNGRVVGRVAGIIDPVFQKKWSADTGFIGFFECVDDNKIAVVLLAAAFEALRERGCGNVLGPVNLSTNDETGLLVHGFDSPPMLLNAYNPPYYARLLEAAGMEPVTSYESYDWLPSHEHSETVSRLLRRGVGGVDGIRIRSNSRKRWGSDNRIIFDLYNEAFAGTRYFTPLTWEEYMERAEGFRLFYNPDLVLIAESAGEPVGFALALPDANVILSRMRGSLWPLGWRHLVGARKRIRTARFILLGVLSSHTGRGIAVLLAHEMTRVVRRAGLERVELSVVSEENEAVRKVIRAFGANPAKTYQLFGRSI